ncbi:BHLH domain-containing protein [Fusarium keratoplasticum]|uniref:BHLH domain-containing protein n=1 Tax=Fusarium keratoplasticum TaxID=1328300 RepID=A0ACC0QAS7_9HYPO|nr:BHLH domain-containing protein [Fusarium keratoplasticum]KAI8648708.1 BHLH domain-containing protein [Fusarium keratoplasticum]
MGSLDKSSTSKPWTAPIDSDTHFGILYWDQDQLQQMTLESTSWESGIWDADGSSGSEYFTQDALLAYGLSDILTADPSPLSGDGPEGDSSNASYSLSPEQTRLDGSLHPADHGTPESPAGEGSRRPARPDITLRSASRKPKKSARRRRPAGPTREEANARECHNMVEKQYRSRLKAQFESLLAVLPVAQPLDHTDQIAAVNPGQCFSRGQVLDAARETILRQQNEIETLTAGRDQLARDLSTLERVMQRGPN